MSEQNLSEESVDEPIVDSQSTEGSFVLTPRMVAIAKGEDPDAVTSESEAEEDSIAEDEQSTEETVETAEESDDDAPEQASWFTAEDQQRALAYGLDPEDLAAYSSREEFGRVLRSIDKAASRREPAVAKVADAPAETAEEAVDDTKPTDANGKINLAYYENNFDEGTVEAMRALRKQQDATEAQTQAIESFQRQQEQAQWHAHVNEFHRSAEEIRPDFFGRTVDDSGLPVQLSQVELDRRQKLWNAAEVISTHMIREQERQGLPPSVPPWKHVLKQAEVLAFGDEIAKHEQVSQRTSRTDQLKKVADQSKRRRPVASNASTHALTRNTPPADPYSTEAILRHPTVDAVLRKIQDRH